MPGWSWSAIRISSHRSKPGRCWPTSSRRTGSSRPARAQRRPAATHLAVRWRDRRPGRAVPGGRRGRGREVLRRGAEESSSSSRPGRDPAERDRAWSMPSPRSGSALRAAAAAGDVDEALAALDQHRLLCAAPARAVRGEPMGRRGRARSARRRGGLPGTARRRVVRRPARPRVAATTTTSASTTVTRGGREHAGGSAGGFARGSGHTLVAPVRLDAVQTVHAMTVHRAQGSQFGCVSFIVPPADSPLLTRELFYTAVTRASRRVQVFGTAEAVERAVLRPANRASGLASGLRLKQARLGRRVVVAGPTVSRRRGGLPPPEPPMAGQPAERHDLGPGPSSPSRQASISLTRSRWRRGGPGRRATAAGRQLAPGVPVGVRDLLVVDADRRVRGSGGEAHHQRARERPRLAAEVRDLGDADVDLLRDLAVDRLLQRLTELHETGQHRDPVAPARLPAEQQPVLGVDDGDDHRRIRPREVVLVAGLAVPGEATVDHPRPATAPGTEARRGASW